MKICIDGLGIEELYGTGLYSYTYNLLSNLLEMYPQPRYELLCQEFKPFYEWQKYKNLSCINLPVNRKENDYSRLEEHLANSKGRIFHSLNNGFSIPPVKIPGCVMTVHDLFPMKFGEFTDSKYYDKFMTVFPSALKNCDAIIAVSDFIKKELMYYFQVPPRKICVIHPGCSDRFTPMEEDVYLPLLKNKYNVHSDFILFAGSIHQRKNLSTLLNAFKKVLSEDNRLCLVIAGKNDGKREEYFLKLKRQANQLGIEDSVIFTGPVDHSDMPYFYNGAKCAVNLSLYEGFPMSTIEAMSCGTPSICMNTSSFEEAAGNGVIYTDVRGTEHLKDIIMNTIYDSKMRNGIIERGKYHSRRHRWDISIKRLINVYESIAYSN